MKLKNTLQGEIRFLEMLYEQLDIGESLFDAIANACHKIPIGWAEELRLAGNYLVHAQHGGLSRQEILTMLARQFHNSSARHLFESFASYEIIGGDIQHNLQNMIQHRMFEIYKDVEKRIEKAPLKLMGPMFLFTFSSVWCFLVSAMIAVMVNP